VFGKSRSLDKQTAILIKRIILSQIILGVLFPVFGFFIDEQSVAQVVPILEIISYEFLVTSLIIFIEVVVILIIYLNWQRNLPKPKKSLLEQATETIKMGEGNNIEFKQTLRWDINEKKINKDLEKVVIKSIAGFLNSKGGTLLIGVADKKTIFGLEKDYQTLPKKNDDGFENHLIQLIKSSIGINFMKFVSIDFIEIKSKEICYIRIKSADKPVFVTNGEHEDFYVRSGNATNSLGIKDSVNYISDRYKKEEDKK
jgi:hypothetical protein